MMRSFFKSSARILIRQKSYTLMNLIGLALGITVFVFIYLYIQSETSYDRCWSNYRNTYRITEEYTLDQKREKLAITPFLLAGVLKNRFPEVKKATRFFFTDPSDKNSVNALKYKGKVYEVHNITIGDKNIFSIFNYPFVEGDRDSALVKPRSLVISQKTAKFIFGNKPALGKKVKTGLREYSITGVYAQRNYVSHLDFNGVVSVSSFDSSDIKQLKTNWFWMNCYTYIQLDDTVSPQNFRKQANQFVDSLLTVYVHKQKLKIAGSIHLDIAPVTSAHFSTNKLYDSTNNLNKSYLYIFGVIALFILLTASINYINLATARSIKRAKEIGIRKVLGARKKQLLWQYLSESFILTFTAFFVALSLVELLMPQFNRLVNKNLTLVGSLLYGNGKWFGIGLLLLMGLLSTLSGTLPAFVISTFQPGNVLRGNTFFLTKNQKKKFLAGRLRQWLVTTQYVVTIGMIITTAVIYSQLHFINNRNPGFDKNNLLVINTPIDTTFSQRSEKLMRVMQNDSSILEVAGTANLPGYTSGKLMFTLGDTAHHKTTTLNNFFIGDHFFQMLHIPLLEGRFFSDTLSDDTTSNYIINEAAAAFLGTTHPLGMVLSSPFSKKGKIIGIVQNFNYSSLHETIEPLVFMLRPRFVRYIMVRIRPGQREKAMKHIQKTWKRFNKGYGMHYTFLNEKLKSLYQSDEKLLSLFVYFSIFFLFISSLGLYGLTSLFIEQRTKEIGIRKVLGGSERRLLFLIFRDYLKNVLIAGLLASPVVYLLMNQWLDGFAYSISLSVWFFVAGILFVLLIALITVFLRSLNIIGQKPAQSLKYE